MRKYVFAFFFTLSLTACQDHPQGHKDHKTTEQTPPTQHDHSTHDHSQEAVKDTTKGSIPKTAMTNLGSNHVHIAYTAAAVRNRVIWGGLVPYDQVWVTGAHQATSISLGKDVLITGQRLPKGKYALFTIPGKQEWTVIINKNWDQHLTDEYSEQEDVLRIKVKPQTDQPHTERLTYRIKNKDTNTADLEIVWEKLKIVLAITNA